MDYPGRHESERMSQHLTENNNGRLIISLRNISHTMRSLYEGRGSQKRVLIVLSETGTITQRELTSRLGIQPGSASEVIIKLENASLVKRTPSEEDRRTANISLTEEGMQQAKAAQEERHQRHEEMFSALTLEEKEQLIVLLEKINTDWQERYGDRVERSDRRHGRHHRGDFESHAAHTSRHHHWHSGTEDGSDYGQERRHHCDHDCENCPRPCGQSQGGRRK